MTPQLSNASQVSKNSIEKQYINLKKSTQIFFFLHLHGRPECREKALRAGKERNGCVIGLTKSSHGESC